MDYYEWEYSVAGPGFERVNVSALAVARVAPGRGGLRLVTLNTQAPGAAWAGDGALRAALRSAAASLRVRQ